MINEDSQLKRLIWCICVALLTISCGPSGAKKLMTREAIIKIKAAEAEPKTLRQLAVERAEDAISDALASGDPTSAADARINLDLKSCRLSVGLLNDPPDGFDVHGSVENCIKTLSDDL